ncbi:MAG: HAD-IIA family hydrolase [Acidimicrobiia bacterium]|nr:HAD-IIA family hydrolase [Acidimicrobiia bacterium]
MSDPTRRVGNLVCDLDGVVYRGETVIPGAGEALRKLDQAGYNIIFATNNSSKTNDQVAEKIGRLSGYAVKPDQVVTSAEAAAALLGAGRRRVYIVGGEGLRTAMVDAGHELVEEGRTATAVVVGFDRDLTYDRLREATFALLGGARFIASNLDNTFPAAGNDLWPGAGSMVAALEASSGRTAEPAGKPFEPMRRLIAAKLLAGPVYAVGDRPETDLELGRRAGWSTVLTLSGITTPTEAVGIVADLVVSTLAELPAALNVS